MIGYEISPADDGILFADHAQLRRSGHVGLAAAQYAPGKLLAFYPNCSGERAGGYSGYGWAEYRRSEDGGESWGEPQVLKMSVDAFLSGVAYVACEKAVSPAENVITAACLRCACEPNWEPYLEAAALISYDGGNRWSDPVRISPYRGRVCDMKVKDGEILALYLCAGAQRGVGGGRSAPAFRLYGSRDSGESWSEVSALPSGAFGTGGALEFLEDGRLAAYLHNASDPCRPGLLLSPDGGRTWESAKAPYLEKGLYEPQLLRAGGAWFLFGPASDGRDGEPCGLVLYASRDGLAWDEGRFIRVPPEEGSGECPMRACGVSLGDRILLQYAQPYSGMRANICHTFIENIR